MPNYYNPRKMMKLLVKLDVLVYIIVSLFIFIAGLLLITAKPDTEASKNFIEMMRWLGGFTLLIGLVGIVLTYLKIKDTYSK